MQSHSYKCDVVVETLELNLTYVTIFIARAVDRRWELSFGFINFLEVQRQKLCQIIHSFTPTVTPRQAPLSARIAGVSVTLYFF